MKKRADVEEAKEQAKSEDRVHAMPDPRYEPGSPAGPEKVDPQAPPRDPPPDAPPPPSRTGDPVPVASPGPSRSPDNNPTGEQGKALDDDVQAQGDLRALGSQGWRDAGLQQQAALAAENANGAFSHQDPHGHLARAKQDADARLAKLAVPKPTRGRVVIYVSQEGVEYPATVVDVDLVHPMSVGLFVMTMQGSQNQDSVPFNAGDHTDAARFHSWHWPPRV